MDAKQRCRRAAARIIRAEADRLQAMKDMHAEGATLVEIAKAAGMSDPGVLKALRRAGVDTSRKAKEPTVATRDAEVRDWNAALATGDEATIAAAQKRILDAVHTRIMNDDQATEA